MKKRLWASNHRQQGSRRMAAGVCIAVLMAMVSVGLAACGTADLYHNTDLDRSQLALIRGDVKLGPFGNATVRLEEVDGHELGSTQRQALVAPGNHTLVLSCKEVSSNASNTDQLDFTARAGATYNLQLRLLNRYPGCSGVLVQAGTGRVVAEPATIKHPPHILNK